MDGKTGRGERLVISLYFGLPGQGKTSILAAHALAATKDKRYKHVYSNVPLRIPGVTYINNDCIGTYSLEDALILIDEGTIFADSRDFKSFGSDKVYYFMLHRHFNVNIEIFVQQWDALDRKIRCITDRVYYVYKRGLFGFWVTKFYRIPYGIIIPDAKSQSQKLGEIVQGYCKPPWYIRLFAKRIFRPKYYKFFDSWDHKSLPQLPPVYKAYDLPQLPKKEEEKKRGFAKIPAPRRLIRGAKPTRGIKNEECVID